MKSFTMEEYYSLHKIEFSWAYIGYNLVVVYYHGNKNLKNKIQMSDWK